MKTKELNTLNSNNNRIYLGIEELVSKYKMDYIDAVVYYCEKNSIEVESVADMIKSNPNIFGQIQMEAEKLNILPKSVRLPF